MSKNIMRTPEEKEKLVLEMINNGYGFHTMSKKHDISKSVLSKWYYYQVFREYNTYRQ